MFKMLDEANELTAAKVYSLNEYQKKVFRY